MADQAEQTEARRETALMRLAVPATQGAQAEQTEVLSAILEVLLDIAGKLDGIDSALSDMKRHLSGIYIRTM